MCGISGYVDYGSNISSEILEKMTNIMSHRGPDGFDTYIHTSDSFCIGLGHRRLSIIELSDGGKQPMHFNNISITFNGEIYNFKEIKQELIELGHQFNSNSDTEVILHAYKEWGIKAINRFIGMFAFVIFDAKLNKLFLVRDRAGVKPLFFYKQNNLLLFASELKAFHENPFFEKKIDLNSVAMFMQYGNVPSPFTIFQNTFKVKAGYYIEIDLNSKESKEICYWDVSHFYSLPKLNISLSEAKIRTTELLKSAFNYRMVADVPIGIFLSGGYDSSCVTAILKEEFENLNTFTIGFQDKFRDEAPEAKKIADYLGTNHTELYCTEKELLDLIDDLPFYYDEPFGDSSAIPTILVSKLAKNHVTVALSADGGDELFAGYYKYQDFFKIKSKLDKIPKFILKFSYRILNIIPPHRIPFFKNKYNFKNRYEKLKNILKNPSNESILDTLNQQFTDKQVVKLFNHTIKLQPIFFNKQSSYSSPLSYALSADYQTYMNDDILQKVDRASMSVSLEGREPFIDHRIVEFVAQLPDEYKFNNGTKKYLLKEIVHDYIPKDLMERPKKGFAIPLVDWLKNDLKEKVEEYINEENITSQNIFNWEEINKIKEEFYQGKSEHDMKLWYILMFQMWYKKWM
ncbi:MAG: asparagine synthase (glutamine-hydrolyzing) [Bacteroidota bacterium]